MKNYNFCQKKLSPWWSFKLGNTRTRHMGVRKRGQNGHFPLGNWV